jgi:tetratricopeptide (TPR) repeat protein
MFFMKFTVTYWLACLLLAAGIIASYRYEPRLPPSLLVQRREDRERAKLNSLNIHMPPDSQRLLEAMAGASNVELREYVQYFKLVTEYMPQQADAYAMLGFCYAYQGQWAESEEALKKSLSLNPYSFWPYYNLGLLYGRTGHPKEAQIILAKALALPLEKTLGTITSSKIYRDIIVSSGKNFDDVVQSLQQGYQSAALLLKIIQDAKLHPPLPHWQFL